MSLLSSRISANRNVARPLAGFSRVLRLRAAALQDIYGVIGRAALPDPELPAYVTRPWHLSREMLKVAVSDSLRTRWPALGRFGDFLPREQVTAIRKLLKPKSNVVALSCTSYCMKSNSIAP